MDGTALRTVRTRRRAVALAAVAAFAMTATACSGGQSASTTTTKSRADMQREAAEKDGTLDLSLVNEGSDISASDAVDAMRVTAVGKTRTDAAATAPSAGGGSSSQAPSGAVTPQAPRPTSSGSATPPAQTPVVPWSGIETRVLVEIEGGTAQFTSQICNTTSRQRTIVQTTATASVRIQSGDGASRDFPASGGGPLTLTLAPSECQKGSVALAKAGWVNKDPERITGGPFTVKVEWKATELGTAFTNSFESSPFVLPQS